jgi:serine phosphatase RsbU (regulator of sigma subunit)/anti-sigma regulatory factor (Ser/Thr protein kinase)
VNYIAQGHRTSEELMDALPPHPDIDPATARTAKEFAELLQRLRTRVDQPSLRVMERWAIKNGKSLSRTSVSEMLDGRTFPTKARLFAFLQVCGVEPAADPRWETAWNRLAEQRRQQQPGISRLGAAGEQAAIALGLEIADDEAADLLEPSWSDAEERLAAITDAADATVDTLRKQLALLRQAGTEVGTTLDSARLSRLESMAAVKLQRSMLPTRPPRIAGVRIAHHYRPGESGGAGGDWFDAIELPGGRVALVIGDVMGHGLLSAAIMGQLRTAVITMAALDLPPAQLLRHLDNLAHRVGTDQFATCVYSIYDPIHRTLTLANAGHIPPVLVQPGGPSGPLDIPTGAPIGVGGVPFETVEISVPDGSWLLLCTDGLIDLRRHSMDEALAALSAIEGDPEPTPDDVCGQILSRLDAAEQPDDAALLVARLDGVAREDVAEWPIPLRFSEVSTARALTRRQLGIWGLDYLTDRAELLISELVTNALQAAHRDVRLRLMRADKLMVEVSDDNPNLPQLRPSYPHSEYGRGLHVVSRLADRWGTSRQTVGKVVWFELSLSRGQG